MFILEGDGSLFSDVCDLVFKIQEVSFVCKVQMQGVMSIAVTEAWSFLSILILICKVQEMI
jgi:hypothetical protein